MTILSVTFYIYIRNCVDSECKLADKPFGLQVLMAKTSRSSLVVHHFVSLLLVYKYVCARIMSRRSYSVIRAYQGMKSEGSAHKMCFS